MLMIAMISFILPTILIAVNSILNKKEMATREKMSPFECGFDPKSSARLPFSIRFYLIAVIFLIFDIEITLIMPIPFINLSANMFYWTTLSLTFTLILLVGLYHEWNQGALNWAK